MIRVPRGACVRRTLAALAASVLAAASAGAQPASSYWFFGDSFSDVGNAQVLSLAAGLGNPTPSPPYAPGVFSNGPAWTQLFAAALGRPSDALGVLTTTSAGYNFAIGGARTDLTGTGGSPTGMLAQTAAQSAGFIFPVVPPGAPPGTPPVPVNLGGARVVDPNGLYTIFGGANNVFDAAANPDPVARAAAVTGALDDIQTIALALRARGASRFLIPFMPNVGLTPQARFIDTFVAPGYVANATAMAQSFNLQLAGRLAALDLLPGVSQVLGLRLDLLLENIRADAMAGGGRYGITNVTLPCIAEPPRFPIAAPSCASALFSDPRHVSGRTHELIADAATRLVLTGQNVTAIPEPGTVALVATGLGVLALGARRRRRAA